MTIHRFAAVCVLSLSPLAATAQTGPTVGDCELHIWPSDEQEGAQRGLLMGFGAIGGLLDGAVHKGKNKSIQDLMRDYLSSGAQVDELRSANVTDLLGLPGYRIVVEQPIPSKDAGKVDPAVEQRRAAMKGRTKGRTRLSDATTPCYAELIGGRMFYQKDPMYGSQLYTGWTFRDFGRDGSAPIVSKGQVKNAAKDFPPKTPDMVAAAQAGLRTAYRDGFVEWVQKKYRKPRPATVPR